MSNEQRKSMSRSVAAESEHLLRGVSRAAFSAGRLNEEVITLHQLLNEHGATKPHQNGGQKQYH